jgi:hypothetical protein
MLTKAGTLLGLILAGALLAGCDNDDDFVPPAATPAPPPLASPQVRFIHASPDAPNVNVVAPAASATLVADLQFKEVSPFAPLDIGVASVAIDAIVPGGTARVLGPVNVTLGGGGEYSIIAAGEAATLAPIVVSRPISTVAAGSVRANVVHAAPNAARVAVYVTTPDAVLAQSTPLGTFAFGESLGPVTVASGNYRVRVTLPNDPGTVVFDSGTATLPSGADLLIVAVENTDTGAAPISLLVATGANSSFEIRDVATPAELRVIHASPDAPAVDVVVNENSANPVLQDVPFQAVSGYLAVPPGTYDVKVTAANNPGAIVIDADLALEAGRQYSVFATGTLATIAPYVLTDDNRPVATAAKVRIVHTAPSAGNVDIYVTAPGVGIANVAPAFAGVPFRAETGYVSLAGGSYDVTVTVAGTKTAAIGPASITVSDGSVYTAAARDATGGGPPFGLILMDEFVP